ncbi:hypothetical protein Val02_77450 [Virgisporangium aliadipatigenens]|uniref:DUF2637 domain-containing protein n=1 Tax=Virgisporangium aliadipatigenens TaxID=741659 RepID=A0A8J4DUI5_9ACTN|nr:DUF2637 domain-containing protein [Virgisporangium aliadipatigenens]GIJ50859.1 hypothetical protein Val02_77450 [Virgisporangium aliadipatigenens]
MPLRQLRRVRWAVRAALVLGVAASVAANVLHAQPNPIAQTISAWPPLALMLTIELISRVPVHRRSLAAVRLIATFAIAGIAAWVSYWHMTGVAARYGETGGAEYLLPLSVDGLIVVASVSLVELAGRIREAEQELRERVEPAAAPPSVAASHPAPARSEAAPQGEGAERISVVGLSSEFVHDGETDTKPVRGAGVGALIGAPPIDTRPRLNGLASNGHGGNGNGHRVSALDSNTRLELSRITSPVSAVSGRSASRPAPRPADEPAVGRAMPGVPAPAQRRGRPVAETRRLAAELTAQQPDATAEDLARQLGITPKRLKSILSSTPAA